MITPIEAANAKNLELRHPHTVEIAWHYFPHEGRKYRLYKRAKNHVETQIKWMAILSTDELFRIKKAIENGIVPNFFKPIVDEIYRVKKQGEHVVSLSIGDDVSKFPLFYYDSEEAWGNPGIPKQAATKNKPGDLLIQNAVKAAHQRIPQNVLDILQRSKNNNETN